MWLNVVLNDTRVACCELWVLLPLCPTGVGTRGKFVLSRNLEYKTRGGGVGGAMWLNVVLNDPLVAYCDLWVLLPLFPTGVGILGKFVYSFYRATGGKWT